MEVWWSMFLKDVAEPLRTASRAHGLRARGVMGRENHYHGKLAARWRAEKECYHGRRHRAAARPRRRKGKENGFH